MDNTHFQQFAAQSNRLNRQKGQTLDTGTDQNSLMDISTTLSDADFPPLPKTLNKRIHEEMKSGDNVRLSNKISDDDNTVPMEESQNAHAELSQRTADALDGLIMLDGSAQSVGKANDSSNAAPIVDTFDLAPESMKRHVPVAIPVKNTVRRDQKKSLVKGPVPANAAQLLQSTVSPLHDDDKLIRTQTLAIRDDMLNSVNGHPTLIIDPHIKLCTEIDSMTIRAQFLGVLSFHRTNTAADILALQYLVRQIGNPDDSNVAFDNGLRLDVHYLEQMLGTKGCEMTRHENIQAYYKFDSGFFVKLTEPALFGTFYISTAKGTILPAAVSLRTEDHTRTVFIYALDIAAPVNQICDRLYGSIGTLRCIPGKTDLHAGTVACINSIRASLKNNFTVPGRYGLILHTIFHSVDIVPAGKGVKFTAPSDPRSARTKTELVAEIIFLGTYDGTEAYHRARNGIYYGARANRGVENGEPLLVYSNGIPLELYDNFQQLLEDNTRNPRFTVPTVTTIHNVPMVLAEDMLSVLAADHDKNKASINCICQAIVLPPVSHVNLDPRLVILWLTEQELDLEPLTKHWGLSPRQLKVDKGFLAGYGDIMRLREMHEQADASGFYIQRPATAAVRTPPMSTGRGGWSGRRGGLSSVALSRARDASDSTSLTATLSPTTDDWTSIVKGNSPVSIISDMVKQQVHTALSAMGQRIDSIEATAIAKEKVDMARAELDRKVSMYQFRYNLWVGRMGKPMTKETDVGKLLEERKTLCQLRETILRADGATDPYALPDPMDFWSGPA